MEAVKSEQNPQNVPRTGCLPQQEQCVCLPEKEEGQRMRRKALPKSHKALSRKLGLLRSLPIKQLKQ